MFINLPVTSPNGSVSHIRAPSFSIRVETILYLIEALTKTAEDLQASKSGITWLSVLHKTQKKAKPEPGIERVHFLTFNRNERSLINYVKGLKDKTVNQNRFGELNIKFCANFFQFKFYCDNMEAKPETPVGQGKPGPTPIDDKSPLESTSTQGVQLILETAIVNLTLKPLEVT